MRGKQQPMKKLRTMIDIKLMACKNGIEIHEQRNSCSLRVTVTLTCP